MPLPAEPASSKTFRSRLGVLRSRIDELPPARQPDLRRLADAAEEFHDQMQSDAARVRELVDDMGLRLAATKFDLWAHAARRV